MTLDEAQSEIDLLKVRNHRLYEALEHMEETVQRAQDWAEQCAQRRVRAENKWRELALENSRLLAQISPI